MNEEIEGQLPQSFAADTLFKNKTTIYLPETKRQFVVKDACIGKAAKSVAALYSILDETGLRDTLLNLDELKTNIVVGAAPNFLSQIMHLVEALLAKSPKMIYRLVGTILLTNAEYAELEESDADLDQFIYNLGRSVCVSDDGSLDNIQTIVAAGVRHLGTASLGEYLPKVLKAFLGA